ncbi:MBL fold metallo-hydrolase [Listeria monocytogenes]|nr:MBL fold metallo-hydrolase [Listeria monocytogenes]EAC7182566.1 MBL fold metallo-hydrolase [Listeria monocytogenes]EAC8000779.1 MBL fold metallo-hydrolase [Listeria monocytogenes]EAC8001295.1 MBL fold metallo-hydrolase [Listeria monocytogenes]EAD0740613.1 MBL fold metallo-hydrolase [Listeria monocytogenes]
MLIKMYYVGASTCLFDIDEKIKIGIDPVLSPKGHKIHFKNFESIRIKSPKYTEPIFKNIDIWLITHSHKDHLDSLGVKAINKNSVVLCDKKTISSDLIHTNNIRVLGWGDTYEVEKDNYSIKITTIPAYHGNSLISRILVGKVNGYLVEISNESQNQKLYFSGDTVYHKDIIRSLPDGIDILIANLGNVRSEDIGGPLTMNLEMLDIFIKSLHPKKVIPVHIDDFSHYETSILEVQQAGLEIITTGKWIVL